MVVGAGAGSAVVVGAGIAAGPEAAGASVEPLHAARARAIKNQAGAKAERITTR